MSGSGVEVGMLEVGDVRVSNISGYFYYILSSVIFVLIASPLPYRGLLYHQEYFTTRVYPSSQIQVLDEELL